MVQKFIVILRRKSDYMEMGIKFCVKILLLNCLVLVLSGSLLAQENYSDDIILEYPRGRYNLTSPPQFFKWSLINPSKTVSLKVYQQAPPNSELEDKLLAKYDFTSDTTSLAWTRAPFQPGNYYWVIEVFNGEQASPVSKGKTNFYVEKIRSLNIKSSTMGPILGLGVGSYQAIDPSFTLSFDTTPRIYGFNYRKAWKTTISETTANINDYTVGEEVTYPYQIASQFLWQVFGKNPYTFEGFLGPKLKLYSVAEVRTTDTVNFDVALISLVETGLTFSVHKQLSSLSTFHGRASLGAPVAALGDIELEMGTLNYSAAVGLFFNVIWPLGFNAELQYEVQETKYDDSGDSIEVTTDSWSLMGQVIYTF